MPDMEIEVQHKNMFTAVKLNGEWIPVHSINIDFARGVIPIVAVELEVPYVRVEGDRVRTYLHPETVRLLKAAGWTPPRGSTDEATI